jgi:serine protease Do
VTLARNVNKTRTRSRACIFQFAFCILQFVTALPSIAQENDSLAAQEEAALKAAADAVAPSVVQIRTIGGLDVVDDMLLANGPTTGLVISADGYILSSAFNFAQQPASILVTFASGKQAPAELVATDHSRMLVLLKVSGMADLPVPSYAPADEVVPGQWAVAMGRTFRADRTNVSVGIVSAVGRMYGKVIQTDADASTANYGGPLVDIRGRVLGVIVPMSPQQGASEVAGTEWYDSGIGFAAPIAPLSERIERMKKGEDQRAGLLGIGFTSKDARSSPAELAVVRPDSPAGKVGLKKGDKIVEINGKPIQSQTDMRFALGTFYGGDSVRVVAMRGDERLERTITLVGEMPAFRHAFLGILPMRPAAETAPKNGESMPTTEPPLKDADDPSKEQNVSEDQEKKPIESGVIVRAVYSGSPAADAGIQHGDRIVEINETKIKTIDDAIQALNNVTPESKVTVELVRDGKPMDLRLTATRLPGNVPAELPPAFETQAAARPEAKASAGETVDVKLAEFPHTCRVYVPSSRSEGQPLGALLWLQSPGDAKPADVIRQWQSICDRDGLILILPTPKDSDHWERPDLEYLDRLAERASTQYRIDPRRLVVGGRGHTGSIAWPLAFAARDRFRGIAAVAAPLPRQVKVLPNDPAQRLAVFGAIPPNKDAAAPIAQGLKSVSKAGYDVTTITTVATKGEFSDTERGELARWIDTLDRF